MKAKVPGETCLALGFFEPRSVWASPHWVGVAERLFLGEAVALDVLFFSGFKKDSGGILRNYFFSILSLGTGSPVPSVHSPGSVPDVGSGLAPPVSSIWRRLLDIPREDTVKIKAQIPYCYLLSLANSVLCLPVVSPLSTPPLCSPSIRSVFNFLSVPCFFMFRGLGTCCSLCLESSFFLLSYLSKLSLNVTSSERPSLSLPPDLGPLL